MSDRTRYFLLAVAVVFIGGVIFYLQGMKSSSLSLPAGDAASVTSSIHTADFSQKSAKYQAAKELVSPSGFVNTDGKAIHLSDYIGKKVILLDFWTYSCINCQRTLPYLTSWYSKYKDQGLVIIGVHTPEFKFEEDLNNVTMATKRFGVAYPVVLDNQRSTWDAYGNQYWPEHYLIDINGLVVDRHIGEGGYDDTEKLIQSLLKERKTALGEGGTINADITQVAQNVQSASPETYFGWSRNEFLVNGKQQSPGVQTMTIPPVIASNSLYLGGTWNFSGEYATAQSAGAKIAYRYAAGEVYIVAHAADKPVTLTILRDGKPVGAEKGDDVASDGTVTVKEARLYKLIHESTLGSHKIEIIVNNPGLQAFTFTFG